ncbi:MAG: outer membrane lipoprotein chaperone LolA [Candidatus Schekmanbacteria bacterium]|nr:outer membrane lipoprotein chaperone LolA [Candidatus Schekmanbacteria bacterium]
MDNLSDEYFSLDPKKKARVKPQANGREKRFLNKFGLLYRFYYWVEGFFSPGNIWSRRRGTELTKGVTIFDIHLPGYFFFYIIAVIIALFVLLVLKTGNVFAATDINQVVTNIQQQYEKIQDMEADFTQEAFSKTIQKKQKSQGKVYMKKPGLMRWDYLNPEKQLIILDKKNLWWYTPENKQVIQQPAGQALDSHLAVTFMSGMGNIDKDFKLEFAAPPQEGKGYELKLIPRKPQVTFTHILLTVGFSDYLTQRFVLYDFYGNVTTISLSNLKINPGLNADNFEFIPPAGVQIITPDDFPKGR